MRTVVAVRRELARLTEFCYLIQHPNVRAAIDKVRRDNEPRAIELRAEIATIRRLKK